MKSGVRNLLLTLALCTMLVNDVTASEELLGLRDNGSSVIVLKIDKEFIGGEVQVYNADNSLIISQRMKKRKMTIDFSAVVVGEYTVRVMKGTEQREFHFVKK